MPSLFTRLARAAGYVPATKASAAIALYGEARAVWTPRDYAALAREGFQRNAVVHRAVRLVAEAAATLPLTLAGADDAHPLIDLLTRPNPREGGAGFLDRVYGHLLVSGNAYLEAVEVEGRPGNCSACAPTGCGCWPGPTAGQRATPTASAGARSATSRPVLCRRSCT